MSNSTKPSRRSMKTVEAVEEIVHDSGIAVLAHRANDVPYLYTIGNLLKKSPELILFVQEHQIESMYMLLHDMCDDIQNKTLTITPLKKFKYNNVEFFPITTTFSVINAYVEIANLYYGVYALEDYKFIQLFTADMNGVFPDDINFASHCYKQPILKCH